MSKFLILFKEYFRLISGILAATAIIILVIAAIFNSEKNQDSTLFGFPLERTILHFEYETPIPLGNNQLVMSITSLSPNDIRYLESPDTQFFAHPKQEKKYKDWEILTWRSSRKDSLSFNAFLPALSPSSLRKGIDNETATKISHYFNYAEQSLRGNSLYACLHKTGKFAKTDYLLLIINVDDGVLVRIRRSMPTITSHPEAITLTLSE
ncbi:hypothetical protein LJC68_00050 [Bacteroidales bacterium OttesenSCG-928-B11]|nr:hypothetical protein [Bacteroidales bacterium OttesenSCG-928-E04]MDL2311255.1 hypothetical protein [Bacteroidales bacterium OttesenSCG-928-B11]